MNATHRPAWPYPRVIAHRGGGALAPENTLAAFETGAKLGMKMVEFDVKLSHDAVPFLLHDDRVDRTSNGQGAAAAMNYSELAALNAGSWFGPAVADQAHVGTRATHVEADTVGEPRRDGGCRRRQHATGWTGQQ